MKMSRRLVPIALILVGWLLSVFLGNQSISDSPASISVQSVQVSPAAGTPVAFSVPGLLPDGRYNSLDEATYVPITSPTVQHVYAVLTAIGFETGRNETIYVAGTPVPFDPPTLVPTPPPYIPLVARDDVFQVDQNGEVVITRGKLLENDSRQDVDIITYTLPPVGTWEQINGVSARWFAPAGRTEDVLLSYTISDGQSTATAQVTIKMYIPPTPTITPTSSPTPVPTEIPPTPTPEDTVIREWNCAEYASGRLECLPKP